LPAESALVASDLPDHLTLKEHRDREGRREIHWRRAGLGLVGVLLLAGLLNVFGQRPATSTAATPLAKLKVYAPKRVRGGLYYEARFTIDAVRELKEATVVLESGWGEGLTINTVEPSPIGEASRDGNLAFELGHIPQGDRYIFFLQMQVNPTNVGHRSQDVWLYDGERQLIHLDRSITVWP
jgi:hypothetical protein